MKKILGMILAGSLMSASTVTVSAKGGMPGSQNGFGGPQAPGMPASGETGGMMPGQGSFGMPEDTETGGFGAQDGMGMTDTLNSADSPTEIITTSLVCTAADLSEDTSNAVTYVMSDDNNEVTIDSAGTYIVSGSCSDGNITVKKNTEGVVLILKDLDLTSTLGAPVSLNKYSQVKVIVEGSVTLTDNEDPADEDVNDDYDGAALKAKDGSNVYLTGTGTLKLNGNAKNGIKTGDEAGTCFVIGGSLNISINASNDAVNAGYDMTILSGTLNITAGDDAIHADRILTIGSDGSGPSVNISSSYEGLEGTVVNLFGGSGSIKSSDDAVNAANSDGTYASEMNYSINITGGKWTLNCTGDGLDSNGNVNITGGYTVIHSGSTGGESGIDYMGTLYVAEGTLENYSGTACDAGMMGGAGFSQQAGGMMPEESGTAGSEGRTSQPGFRNGMMNPGMTQPDGSSMPKQS